MNGLDVNLIISIIILIGIPLGMCIWFMKFFTDFILLMFENKKIPSETQTKNKALN